ncbi:hypothetical protein BDW59DRAFT_89803 [Aspergillus cavernicola]|uniref:Secreted protein n=1 Tax=Aspergillus cavernicola TaxID=176166 RepID=A0ABR4IAM9_9EURO
MIPRLLLSYCRPLPVPANRILVSPAPIAEPPNPTLRLSTASAAVDFLPVIVGCIPAIFNRANARRCISCNCVQMEHSNHR